MNEQEIQGLVKDIVEKIVREQVIDNNESITSNSMNINDDVFEVEDITKIDLKKELNVKNPHNKEAYLKMKSYTPARIGVGRTGNRYLTTSSLRFRADHAAAMDAVFSMVDTSIFDELNQDVLKIKTICESKDQYVTRPDYGKLFDQETSDQIKNYATKNANVQIVIGDGLSSAAIMANIKDVIPALLQGLKSYNLTVSRLIFVEYCRVGAMDAISELTGADVTLLLIGERPGLVTAESMSAYMAYKATVGMPEAKRTVISNIHKGGTPAVEAGAHLAGIVKRMIDEKISGVELKL